MSVETLDRFEKRSKPEIGSDFASQRKLLSVRNLCVTFETPGRAIRAVRGVDFDVAPGEIVALVGESGSGKSVSAMSMMGLLPITTARVTGQVSFEGRDLLGLDESDMRDIRGRQISMIFQEPMTSLNPVLTVGLQITEALQAHVSMTRVQAEARAVELMSKVGIQDARNRLHSYPHQFSGGMRQRLMIAIGIACNPRLIIADEPTTALDVTIQAQILELMRDLSRDLGIALIIITHNLGIVARYADRVYVMYAGRIVEEGDIDPIFATPRHPYTMGLLRSVPRLDEVRLGRLNAIRGLPPSPAEDIVGCAFADRCPFSIDICRTRPALAPTDVGTEAACFRSDEIAQGKIAWADAGAPLQLPVAPTSLPPMLEFAAVSKRFGVRTGGLFRSKAEVKAVSGFSLAIRPGETLGLVGESGCGKTTVGRLALAMETPSDGKILFNGADLAAMSAAEFKDYRRRVQVVFQDPFSSLNPRMTVEQTIEEPMQAHGIEPRSAARRSSMLHLLDQVGLRPEMANRYPHQLSGGQRQRVGIARALALRPSLIVCDEAVSALDVSIQGQVMNLLQDLQQSLNLTYLFIAHDLAVVRHISTRVAVMYLGRLMELADRDELYREPLHPYTQLLLEAAPIPDPVVERARPHRIATGETPSPIALPPGCVFSTRCPLAGPECRAVEPEPREVRPGHFVACIKV